MNQNEATGLSGEEEAFFLWAQAQPITLSTIPLTLSTTQCAWKSDLVSFQAYCLLVSGERTTLKISV